jgi:hypothetical protein
MPNYNPTTGIPYGVIAVQSLNQDWIWDEIAQMDSPELDEAFQEAARERLLDLVRSGEVTYNDFDEGLEPGDEEEAVAGLTGQECVDLVDSVDPHWGQGWWDGIDESEFRKEGEIDGVKVSVSSLGGASLLWVLESPYTGLYRPCSPCIPGAGDLDSPDPDFGMQCYDTPPDWREQED